MRTNDGKKKTVALDALVGWLDATLDVAAFASDVSNNGLQIARSGETVAKVAFAVDADADGVARAAAAGAQLLVVHHGVSWGGGIKRLVGGVYNVVARALAADLAVYAAHLPLDAHEKYGNNFEWARQLGLTRVARAFSWHGACVGVTGFDAAGRKVGLCSGGGGAFAEEAKRLGCAVFYTGEADWGEKIAAGNCGMEMACKGHYETETFGVKALARAVARRFGVETLFVQRPPERSAAIAQTLGNV